MELQPFFSRFNFQIAKSILLATSLTLAACGGGGSSSDGGGGTEAPAENAPPVADAGEDKTVDEGEAVVLANTSTDSDGEIIGYSWSQTSGTNVSLVTNDLDSGNVSFIAPDTVEVITLEFQLSVEDDDGAKASDTVSITINPVNVAPEVQADRKRDAIDNGIGSNLVADAVDPDGFIVAYQWEQLSGPTVALENPDSIVATIPAQGIFEPATYEFKVTVTDNEGGVAEGVVAYTLYPADYPRVFVEFPVQGVALQSSTIRLKGSAYAGADTGRSIQSVAITTADGERVVEGDGNGTLQWSFSDINVSLDEDPVYLTITTTDSDGNSYPQTIYYRTGDRLGSGPALSGVIDVVAEEQGYYQYVLVEGATFSDVDIIKVVGSGHRQGGITDNSDTDLGPQINAATRMLLDEAAGIVYVGTTDVEKPLIAVDLETGVRTLIAGPGVGSGPELESVYGMTFGDTTEELYVADNMAHSIYHINLSSGETKFVADGSTGGIQAPLDLAFDGGDMLFVSQNTIGFTSIIGLDLSQDSIQGANVSDDNDEGPELEPYSHGLYLSADGSSLFMLNASADQLLDIDLATGDRREIAGAVTGSESFSTFNWKGMDYHNDDNVIYVTGGDGQSDDGLYAIDPVSGTKVLMSR